MDWCEDVKVDESTLSPPLLPVAGHILESCALPPVTGHILESVPNVTTPLSVTQQMVPPVMYDNQILPPTPPTQTQPPTPERLDPPPPPPPPPTPKTSSTTYRKEYVLLHNRLRRAKRSRDQTKIAAAQQALQNHKDSKDNPVSAAAPVSVDEESADTKNEIIALRPPLHAKIPANQHAARMQSHLSRHRSGSREVFSVFTKFLNFVCGDSSCISMSELTSPELADRFRVSQKFTDNSKHTFEDMQVVLNTVAATQYGLTTETQQKLELALNEKPALFRKINHAKHLRNKSKISTRRYENQLSVLTRDPNYMPLPKMILKVNDFLENMWSKVHINPSPFALHCIHTITTHVLMLYRTTTYRWSRLCVPSERAERMRGS
jgi:hypothetical protein